MLFGIKMFENKNGLERVNDALNRYGSTIMFFGKNTGIFLTNPIEALKVAHVLNKRKNYFKYKVYKLKDWEVSEVKQKDVVKNYKEYFQLENEQSEEVNRKIEKMIGKMSEEQRLKYFQQEEDTEMEK